ncbi:MAG: ATP-binding protein [Sphingobacteriia bacterium]|nr:MAG: ATP-binding protein [Sphingobacteriia bacterium]
MQPRPAIDSQRIRLQLKYDLIGKDAYRGVTLSYAYLANQTGHFALAFGPAAGIYLLLTRFWPALSFPGLWAGGGMALVWIVFELYNISQQLKEGKGKDGKYVFAPDNKNIIEDTAIDMGYFTFGGLSFAAGSTPTLAGLWMVPVLLLVYLLYRSRSWYITKICQQTAQYPYQLRLSQWNHPIQAHTQALVENYYQGDKTGKHLLVFGMQDTGKTSLAVALANEQSIKRQACLYTTGTKLLAAFHEKDETILAEDPFALCTWRTADCLVIDDIHPGDPVVEETLTPAIFGAHLNALPENLPALLKGNIIWVLGSTHKDQWHNEWEAWLLSLGVLPQNIQVLPMGLA